MPFHEVVLAMLPHRRHRTAGSNVKLMETMARPAVSHDGRVGDHGGAKDVHGELLGNEARESQEGVGCWSLGGQALTLQCTPKRY